MIFNNQSFHYSAENRCDRNWSKIIGSGYDRLCWMMSSCSNSCKKNGDARSWSLFNWRLCTGSAWKHHSKQVLKWCNIIVSYFCCHATCHRVNIIVSYFCGHTTCHRVNVTVSCFCCHTTCHRVNVTVSYFCYHTKWHRVNVIVSYFCCHTTCHRVNVTVSYFLLLYNMP